MKRIVIVLSLVLVVLVASSAVAEDKVVVIPLNNSNNTGLQHYRTSSNAMGPEKTGCYTAIFSTANENIQAVIRTGVSRITANADDGWWSVAQYTTDGGTTWTPVNAGADDYVVISGAVPNTFSNTSENAFVDLLPNSTYQFRIELKNEEPALFGICELFITFNQKAPNDIVTITDLPAAATGLTSSEEASRFSTYGSTQ